MSQKIWIKKPCSFSEARDQDLEYYFNMSTEERLEIMQFLREQYFKLKGTGPDESEKGLRRIARVVQKRKITEKQQPGPNGSGSPAWYDKKER